MTDKARQRKSCPHCNSISVVRRKRSEWHCQRCGAQFQKPVLREYAYTSDRLPPCLITIIEKRRK